MTDFKEEKSIIDIVISGIKDCNTKMKPKWFFVLKSLFFGISTFVIFVLVLFLSSLTIYILTKSGLIFIPSFGLKGFKVFILSLPWILLLMLIILTFTFEVMIRNYRFTYKRPIFYSLVGVLLFVVIGGTILFKIRIHDSLANIIPKGEVFGVGSIYNKYLDQKLEKVYMGIIDEFLDYGFIINNRGEKIPVHIFKDTKMPKNNDLEIGDDIVIFGARNSEGIDAFGVKRLNNRTIKKIENLSNKDKYPQIKQKMRNVSE